MDSYHIIKLLAAFAFVMALMWLLSIAMKRLGYGQSMITKREDRRLKMVEYLPLDTRNRLVLVARDGVEHLLLVNAEHSVIVEHNIKPPKKGQGRSADDKK